MSGAPLVTDIRFAPASRRDVESGLLGFVSCAIDHLRVQGIALRKSKRGRRVLSFPCRRDSRGQRHALVAPIDDRALRAIEEQVFKAIALKEAS